MDAELRDAKLDAMKELAYGASHEINNPLANIAARAQALLRDEPHPERRRSLEAIYQQAMRAHEMISDLMLFARPPELEATECDLCQVVEEVCAGFGDESTDRGVGIRTRLPEAGMVILADPGQLAVASREMVRNALEAIGSGGSITVTVRQSPDGDAEVLVQDTGSGLTEREQTHLFDPFFSGREAGRGLGFGLSKVWRIARAHGGDAAVENAPEGGVVATLRLPPAGTGRAQSESSSMSDP